MQELTPLDIQKQLFSRTMRGFSIDEVRSYLHVVAEEFEQLLKDRERLYTENKLLREELAEYNERERILKDTLLSAQRVSEDLRETARRESEMIVKDAELRAERILEMAMQRVGELERVILDLKIQRKDMRNHLQATIETFSNLVEMDKAGESSEAPLTQIYRKQASEGS
jgi:cell division initiation protein